MLHTYELDVLHSNFASDLFLQLHLFPFMTPAVASVSDTL